MKKTFKTQEEKVINSLKIKGKSISLNSIMIESLFLAGGTISKNQAKKMCITLTNSTSKCKI